MEMPVIKICYDNVSVKKGVAPAWGFAALVTYGGKNILFDTGGKAEILLSNMKALGIAPAAVTDIFVSHNHWDHTGGLFSFLSRNNKVKVFLPSSFSETYCREVRGSGVECARLDKFTRLAPDIYSTGPLGKTVVEQALVIDTPKGLIVLTGCAHPGVVSIIETAKRSLGKPVFAVLGGFHLADKSRSEVAAIIAGFRKLGVAYAGPCHCTGKKAIQQFKGAYQEHFLPIAAGAMVDLAGL